MTALLTALGASMPIWLPILVGLVGTGLKATSNPVMVALGEKLTAIGSNLPELFGWEQKAKKHEKE